MFVLLLTAALAAPATPLEAGVSVRIVDVDPEDAFFSDKATLIGLSCTAGDEGLSPKDAPGWYGGRVSCTNGSSYYFYKVQLSVAGAPVPPPRPPEPGGVVGGVVVVGPPLSKITSGNGVATSSGTPPSPGAQRPTGLLREGSRVRILDVSPEDSYYDDRSPMIGVVCTLSSDQEDDDGWYSGAADDCTNGSSYYFFQAALELVGKPGKGAKSK